MIFHLSRRSFTGLIVTALVAAFAPTLRAQPEKAATNYSLSVEATRPGAIYQQGEEVTFNVKLLLDQKPVPKAKVRWMVSKDDVRPKKSGWLKLRNGNGTVTGKLEEPGFLQCQVKFQIPAGGTLMALAGAGIDPLEIKPSLPVPEDFDAFWSAQKARLVAVPMNPRLTRIKSRPQVECYDVRVDCVGVPVSGYFAKPVGAKPKSLPVILTVQGAGVRSSNKGGTVEWAQKGFLAMDINAHGIPNDQPEQFYVDLANGELKNYQLRGRESRETVYFLGMFLREIRALDFNVFARNPRA